MSVQVIMRDGEAEYAVLPWAEYQALLAVVAALVYFVMPLDLVPDWLLGVGLLDDLAVLAWVLRTWEDELDAYRTWRDAQAPEVLRRVEALPDARERQPG